MHSMQHISLLSLVADDSLSEQQNSSLSFVIVNDEKEYMIDDILNTRVR
jgi:hypothetical protein